ncbi:MAG: hypothetical protein N2039_00325 [Gemmataceae bacterium]|nr:hypothetical protein [Gemmataceae bacterium]
MSRGVEGCDAVSASGERKATINVKPWMVGGKVKSGRPNDQFDSEARLGQLIVGMGDIAFDSKIKSLN